MFFGSFCFFLVYKSFFFYLLSNRENSNLSYFLFFLKAAEATQKVTFCSLSSSNDDHASSLFGQESAPMIALQKNLFDLNSQSDAAKNQQLQQKGYEDMVLSLTRSLNKSKNGINRTNSPLYLRVCLKCIFYT